MNELEAFLKELEEKANSAQPVAIHAHETGIFTIQENTVVTDKETIKKLIAVIRQMKKSLEYYTEVNKINNGVYLMCDAENTLEDCEKIVKGE